MTAHLEKSYLVPQPLVNSRQGLIASMCYTPDVSSNHYGFNGFSGDIGLSLGA